MFRIKEQRTREMKQEAQNLIDKAYARGLDDAWDAARKICVSEPNGGLSHDELVSIFGTCSFNKISKYNAASEAIAKIRQYEEQKKAEEAELKVGTRVRTTKEDFNGVKLFPVGTVGVIDSGKLQYKISANGDYWYYTRDMFEVIDNGEIIVGDEVIDLTFPEPEKAIVIKIYDEKISVVWDDGSVGTLDAKDFKKTGRTFPQIPEVLKQLKETNDADND